MGFLILGLSHNIPSKHIYKGANSGSVEKFLQLTPNFTTPPDFIGPPRGRFKIFFVYLDIKSC